MNMSAHIDISIQQALQGDPVALDQLLRITQPDVKRYARRYCMASDVDDATQEAFMRLAPAEAQAFMKLKTTSERADGHIPAKHRELIALGVALTTQCAYCIDAHLDHALQEGVTQEELAETVFIAAALRAGAAVGHGLMAYKLYERKLAAGIAG
jgi:AhpD family alkylhydroperoxidase